MTTEPRYYARSASDNTDNWPLWFVADRLRGGLNVTVNLLRDLTGEDVVGLPFLRKRHAAKLAEISNRGAHDLN